MWCFVQDGDSIYRMDDEGNRHEEITNPVAWIGVKHDMTFMIGNREDVEPLYTDERSKAGELAEVSQWNLVEIPKDVDFLNKAAKNTSYVPRYITAVDI